jgi:chromosome segregation ATPase
MAELRQMRNEMLLQLGRLACAEDSTPAHSFKLQVYQVQRDLDELRTGRAALAAELEAHDAVTAASTAARESELAAVAAELEPLEIAAVEAERRLGALRTEVATLQRDASRAEQAAQRLRAEIDGLGTARLSAQQRIARDAELEGQRLEQQRLARVARERASRLVTELEKAAVELERQREKRDQVANRLAELQRSIAAAKVEAARARGVLVETLAAADGRMESKTKEQTRLLEACGAMVAREWPEQSPFNVVVARLRKVEEELDSSPDLTANGSRHNPKVALIVVAVVIVVVILVLLVYALGGWAT